MSSIHRVSASRANGALSKGPVTAEGKRRASQNATTHGLLSQHVVMRDESTEGFKESLEIHVEGFRPANRMEYKLVQDMTTSQWCQDRALAMENRLLENEAALQPDDDSLDRLSGGFKKLSEHPALHLLNRYQSRLNRQYQRQLQNMLILRTLNLPNEPSAFNSDATSPISGHSDPPVAAD